jgi:serine phosphatase RsbU (regulator of sigma subunit)
MRAPELEELAFADASDAVRQHFDAINYRRSRLLWVAFLCLAFGGTMAALADGWTLPGLAAFANFVALLALLPLRKRAAFAAHFPTVLLALLALEILLWTLLVPAEGDAIAIGATVVSFALVALRLRLGELLAVLLVALGSHALRLVALPPVLLEGGEMEPAATTGSLIAVSVLGTIAATVGASITARSRREFLARWRQTASRERERLRMREELHDARAIQLAMLPDQAPRMPGLDVAGVCIPASEVGGDYFDYFVLDSDTLTVAVGDVAGHGMASGLVLAGVRAGLHLLSPELLASPSAVLARLNELVGRPGGQRLLMTLGLASFSMRSGRASWVAAGHPPPLHFVAADGSCESPHRPHPPLGTRLPVHFAPVHRPLAPGDAWLLVSDGAFEARNRRGEELGTERLRSRFAELAAAETSADTILDGLLAELDRFRGDLPQDDDITMVVVRATRASDSTPDAGRQPSNEPTSAAR